MYVEKLFPNWRGQYDRMMRWYERFEEINREKKEKKPDFFKDHDTVYAFFQNCYHLKDYIINDPSVSLPKDDVENYIQRISCLKLCSDIANGTKHLKLTKSKSGLSPIIDPLSVTCELTPKGKIKSYKIKYSIETEVGYFDAFETATECVQRWKEFIDDCVKPTTQKPSLSAKKTYTGLYFSGLNSKIT